MEQESIAALESRLDQRMLGRIVDRVCEAGEKGLQRGVAYGLVLSAELGTLAYGPELSCLGGGVGAILSMGFFGYLVDTLESREELKRAVREKQQIYPEQAQDIDAWADNYKKQCFM